MVGFRDLVGVGIAPVSKKVAVKLTKLEKEKCTHLTRKERMKLHM